MREFEVRRALHAWPRSAVLAKATERSLRDLGLGYRAAYISQAARRLAEEDGRMLRWLQSFRANPAVAPADAMAAQESEKERERRLSVREELCRLPGIGAKVADCVALFGLGFHGAVPVDVHVWRITVRDYEPALREAKSLTPAVYEEVGDAFRRRFGAAFAGWAHSVLFGAELAAERLPADLRKEMEEFRTWEKQQKQEKKAAKKPSAKAAQAAKPQKKVPAVRKKPASTRMGSSPDDCPVLGIHWLW
ncbi:OGG1 [Symbiodinium natans]|uniref:DNA-(apurinic or apyrimidinic site) lyase n=1 Tax=Symbiodinium natans TaxID=878477 RepID=A0A812RN32_9DINO|nr:OGG1 [Symbiodinium natans]